MSDDPKENPGLPAPPAPSKGPLLLALVNAIGVMAALGALVYTRVLYKRPMITEDGERDRLAAVAASPTPAPLPGMISFEPVTVNIKASPSQPKPLDGTAQQIQGKLHYVTLGFSLEVRDLSLKTDIEAISPMYMDRVLTMLGHKSFQELTTVQGRYVLRTQLLETANELLVKHLPPPPGAAHAAREPGGQNRPDPIVTGVYFTQFIVQ